MSSPRPTPIPDERLRAALERRPDEQRLMDEFVLIMRTVERTGRPSSPTTSRLRIAAVLVVLALMLVLVIALAVGSLPRLVRLSSLSRTGLVAVDVAGDIWVANPDGTDRRRVTSGPTFDWEPVWSPDGTKLAYWSLPSDPGACACSSDQVSLTLLDMAASTPGSVTVIATLDGWDGSRSRPAWASDSRRLAYAGTIDGVRRLFIVDVDTPSATQVGPDDLDGWDPSWSPDGRTIAFVRGHVDLRQRGLYLMAPDGSTYRRLTTIPSKGAGFLDPAWSPAGDRIAFAAETQGSNAFQQDIWVVGLDGSAEVDVSNDPADEVAPHWSPDGQSLAYLREVDAFRHTYQVIITYQDGMPVTTLPQDLIDVTPAWSPDGTRVLAHAPDPSAPDSDQVISIDWHSGLSSVIAAGHTTGAGSWQRLGP